MLVTETTGIKLLPKIIVLNPKDGIFNYNQVCCKKQRGLAGKERRICAIQVKDKQVRLTERKLHDKLLVG